MRLNPDDERATVGHARPEAREYAERFGASCQKLAGRVECSRCILPARAFIDGCWLCADCALLEALKATRAQIPRP
jgi:hypothetical protein